MHLLAECRGFGRAVAQAQGGVHVAFGRSAQAGAASAEGLGAYLGPEVALHLLDFFLLGVAVDFFEDKVDFLHLQVDDVVHDALGAAHVVAQQPEVELSLRREGVLYERIEVDGQQTAAVVGAEGYLAAGVGGYGLESEVSVAVGHRLAADGVPEEDARLGRLPCVAHYLLPEGGGVDFLHYSRGVRVHGVLLAVGGACLDGFHESVVDAHRHVGARHLARSHLGVDESLRVGVLYRHCHHQGTAAAVLGHFAGGVGVALHEGDEPRRCQGRVLHRRAFGAEVRQVVTHAASALHQLHLFLVHEHDAPVAVGLSVDAHHEAVRERAHLEVVADAGHRAALRDYVAEVAEEPEDFVLGHAFRIFRLDACQLGSDAVVHVIGSKLVDVSVAVFQRVFAYPHLSGESVAAEILK